MSLSDNDYRKMQSVIRFTNISEGDFEHTFAWGDASPVLHRFNPGESRVLPFPIANHLAKHLAVAILRGRATAADKKLNKSLASPEKVAALKLDILSDASSAEVVTPKSANDVIATQIDSLNPEDKEIVAPEGGEVETKADIIAELEKRGIKFNARRSKAELKEQLEAGESLEEAE